MRKIWTIASLRLKSFFKQPGAIVLMIVMPAIFSFIFGGIAVNSEKTKPLVNVVVGDGEINAEVFSLLKKNDDFSWKKVSLKQARENVSSEDVLAAVVIPNDLEQRMLEKKPLFNVIIERKTENYYALQPHLRGTANLIMQVHNVSEGQGLPAALEALAKNKSIAVDRQVVQKEENSKAGINLMVVGFAIMFMMFGLSSAASTILEERMGGTWGRLMVSPASKLQISLGYLLSYFLMGWIQFAVLMVVMGIMFKAEWGNLLYLIPYTSLVIACVVGFGLMIAGIVKTKQQAMALGSVLIVSTCMLGGVYWSLDLVPEFMQKISMAVPQSWAMSGFKEIVSGSLHSGILLKDTVALVCFSVLFFVIGLRGMKFE